MNPGRELDALVAERVMGWWRGDDEAPEGEGWYKYDELERFLDWSPSRSIADAWGVVEKLDMFGDRDMWLARTAQGRWEMLDMATCMNERPERLIAFGDTATHVICLAALKAVGVTV